MTIIETGNGRRVRCPICNCMFTFSKEDVKSFPNQGTANIVCPDCGTTIGINLTINPKQDVYGNFSK